MATAIMGRPTLYQGQVLRTVESSIRRLKSLRAAQRELAEKQGDKWPWSENGPSIKTLRTIHRAMTPKVVLENQGGAPRTYTDKQRREMARLGFQFGITGDSGAVAILRAANRLGLSNRRNKEIFPKPTTISPPTVAEAMELFPKRR